MTKTVFIKLFFAVLLLSAISCKKNEEKINSDTVRFQFLCKECTVEIKGPHNNYLTTRFAGSIELEEKYSLIIPFTGRVILHSDQPATFSISASVIGNDSSLKRTIILTQKKPAAVNLETTFDSRMITN